MSSVKLTKKTVDVAVCPPGKAQILLWNSELKCLGSGLINQVRLIWCRLEYRIKRFFLPFELKAKLASKIIEIAQEKNLTQKRFPLFNEILDDRSGF